MDTLQRAEQNPILKPDPQNPWESDGAFNGSVAFDGKTYHMVYRALSGEQDFHGARLKVSSIGYAKSSDGVNFTNHRQLIAPTEEWEKYGCEDPRITKLDGVYYIFYTALSEYPFNQNGIKVAVAITKNFEEILEKHPVTPFNAKAMTLFPEKINGGYAALLTVHTDNPPARVCLALFDNAEDIWSPDYWQKWYDDLEDHVLFVRRNGHDHVEIGAPPVKTKDGWLAIFSYIKDYFAPPATFGVEAILLDTKNPFKIIGRTMEPIIQPETDYERNGNVPNIVFPTGALLAKNHLSIYPAPFGTKSDSIAATHNLKKNPVKIKSSEERCWIYYGAADTTTCLATLPVAPLLKQMIENGPPTIHLRRSSFNPILSPISNHGWEAKAVFNPAAWYDGKIIHLLYRAQGPDNTSVFGYAASWDGLSLAERFPEPAYVPRETFEQKLVPGGNSGCEDPRLTQIGDRLYLCYTAYDGIHPPRVALSSISVKDFCQRIWNWEMPKLISPPDQDDKDAALFPKKINGQYAILHRLGQSICLDFSPDLNFGGDHWIDGRHLMNPREDNWDSVRIGIAAPPIETEAGWLLLYHGISHHTKYRLGAALLDLKDPTRVWARTDEPILEPELSYEKFGQVPRVVFPCGAVVVKGELFVYYGGADTVVGVAHIKLKEILG